MLAIARSYSAGVVGWFVERLAQRGLVALAFANSSASIAPWGGSKALFGTNPLGFAAPRPNGPPIVVDMASSATARVNIVQAANRGEAVPPGWVFDSQGKPTTDPKALLAGGSVGPLGGPKGYGLALMVALLAAGLTLQVTSRADAAVPATSEGLVTVQARGLDEFAVRPNSNFQSYRI